MRRCCATKKQISLARESASSGHSHGFAAGCEKGERSADDKQDDAARDAQGVGDFADAFVCDDDARGWFEEQCAVGDCAACRGYQKADDDSGNTHGVCDCGCLICDLKDKL